jgi:DNA mismatch repair ATPase MutS
MNKKLYHYKNVYEDLKIETDVFNIIDRTITKYGKLKLQHKLSYCSTDPNELEILISKNYTIHLDVEYQEKMIELLNKFKESEDILENWMNEECNKNLIFDLWIFNNSIFLSISNKLKITSIIIITLIYILGYIYLNYLNVPITISGYIYGLVKGYYNFLLLMFYFIFSDKLWIQRTAFIITSLYVGFLLYLSYQQISETYEHYIACDAFYTEYENILSCIEIVENMYHIDIYNDDDNKESIKESIEYLKYYFAKDSSLGYSMVAKLYKEDYNKHMNKLVNYVGKIDYQISISILISEGYQIPNIIPLEKSRNKPFPELNIEGCWNPLIDNDIIKNSINMDVLTPNIMIISGPNKSGKSTYMKSIMLSVYLAQSIGICCADKMNFTPFRNLYTYMNIPDIIGRESLYEAEINRCYQYINEIESLRGFSFGIIDELFTGTSPSEGKSGSYAIMKRISENPTNITIITTHYHDILENLNNESDQKYKFKKFITMKLDGIYRFDYKIYDGISNQRIGLELLAERGFDQAIVKDAYKYMDLYETIRTKQNI